MGKASYWVGLDLGTMSDYSALVVLEKSTKRNVQPIKHEEDEDRRIQELLYGKQTSFVLKDRQWSGANIEQASSKKPMTVPENYYACRHIERFKLGTSYVDIVDTVTKMFTDPPLSGETLCIDATGVGRPVVDMFRKAASYGIASNFTRLRSVIRPITITAGSSVKKNKDGFGWNVSKVHLVGVLQSLLSSDRLAIAKSLPEASTLIAELLNFKVKLTANAREKYEAEAGWREGNHDDLVLATAIACWCGESLAREFWVRT